MLTAEIVANDLDRQLSVNELRYYGLNRNQAFALMGAGKLAFTQLVPGGKRTVRKADVLKVIAEHTRGGRSEVA